MSYVKTFPFNRHLWKQINVKEMVRTGKIDENFSLSSFLLTEAVFRFSEICRLCTVWCIILIVVVGVHKSRNFFF